MRVGIPNIKKVKVVKVNYSVRKYTDKEVEDFFEFDKKESKKLRKQGLL